jgi:hypothetical protein
MQAIKLTPVRITTARAAMVVVVMATIFRVVVGPGHG